MEPEDIKSLDDVQDPAGAWTFLFNQLDKIYDDAFPLFSVEPSKLPGPQNGQRCLQFYFVEKQSIPFFIQSIIDEDNEDESLQQTVIYPADSHLVFVPAGFFLPQKVLDLLLEHGNPKILDTRELYEAPKKRCRCTIM